MWNVKRDFNVTVNLMYSCSLSVVFMRLHSLTCRTEEEGVGFPQVLVHLISDGHLSVGEGAERLFIGRTHLSPNVVKQQREGPAAKLLHLPKYKKTT